MIALARAISLVRPNTTYAVPVPAILADLRWRLRRLRVPPPQRDLTQALIDARP
jgi:hypothetical protein